MLFITIFSVQIISINAQSPGVVRQLLQVLVISINVLSVTRCLHTVVAGLGHICQCVLYHQVLSDGRLMELEAPHMLLQRGSGMFYDMVQQTGKADAEFLASIAADAYNNRSHANSRSSSGIESVNQGNSVDANLSALNGEKKGAQSDGGDSLEAPLAYAESFHSLLKPGRGEEDECDDGGEGSSEDEKLTVPAEEATPAVSDATLAPVKDPEVPLQVSAPQSSLHPVTDPSANPLNRSTLTDTSLDDDVFAEDPSARSIPIRSNLLPAMTLKDDEKQEEGKGSSDQLPRVESGLGTDVNGSDSGDNPSDSAPELDTPASEANEPPAEDSHSPSTSSSSSSSSKDSSDLDAPSLGTDPDPGLGDASSGKLETTALLGDVKSTDEGVVASPTKADKDKDVKEAQVEDSTELDALISPSSPSEAENSLRI